MGVHLGGNGKGGDRVPDGGGQYIATLFLLHLCEGTERAPGAWVGMRWWEQAEINLAGAREATEAATEAEEDGVEE